MLLHRDPVVTKLEARWDVDFSTDSRNDWYALQLDRTDRTAARATNEIESHPGRSTRESYSRWLGMNDKDIMMVGLAFRPKWNARLFERLHLASRTAINLVIDTRRVTWRLFPLIASWIIFQRRFSFCTMNRKARGRPPDPAVGFGRGDVHRRRCWSFGEWQHRFVDSREMKIGWLHNEATFQERWTFVHVPLGMLVQHLRPSYP